MSTASSQLYDTDFYGWVQQQVGAMRAGNFSGLDMDHLVEEIEDMGKRQKQELRSRLSILFMHLLKWRYQPALQSRSWASTIKVQRIEIDLHIEDNPSLKQALSEIVETAWKVATAKAENETGMPVSTFPAACPWTFEQVMDHDFWPATTAP